MTQLHRKEVSDIADVSRVEVSRKLVHKYAQLQRFSLNICSLRTRRQRAERRMFKPTLLELSGLLVWVGVLPPPPHVFSRPLKHL